MDAAALAAVVDLVVVDLPGVAPPGSGGHLSRPRLPVLEAAAHLVPPLGGAVAGQGVDDVPPHVLHARLVRPEGLAGDGAFLAAETLVQVKDHGDLLFYGLLLSHDSCSCSGPLHPPAR